MESKLVQTLVCGLREAQKVPLQLTELAEETGVSRSTLVKLLAGDNDNIKAPNLERVYCALVRRGYLPSQFTFPVAA